MLDEMGEHPVDEVGMGDGVVVVAQLERLATRTIESLESVETPLDAFFLRPSDRELQVAVTRSSSGG